MELPPPFFASFPKELKKEPPQGSYVPKNSSSCVQVMRSATANNLKSYRETLQVSNFKGKNPEIPLQSQQPRCKQRGIKLATLQSSGVCDPRGIRQGPSDFGSLLAGINVVQNYYIKFSASVFVYVFSGIGLFIFEFLKSIL